MAEDVKEEKKENKGKIFNKLVGRKKERYLPDRFDCRGWNCNDAS
jgi:hypothetical protein